jgi:hypothetical protein
LIRGATWASGESPVAFTGDDTEGIPTAMRGHVFGGQIAERDDPRSALPLL